MQSKLQTIVDIEELLQDEGYDVTVMDVEATKAVKDSSNGTHIREFEFKATVDVK